MARRWIGVAALLCVAGMMALSSGCGLLGREYEYEEQLYLDPSGSATIVIDSSIPALVALRGLPIDPSPSARVNREAVRAWLTAHGCQVTRIPDPWRRHGRRFMQIRLSTDDVKTLGGCALTAWSSYSSLAALSDGSVQYQQRIGASADGNPGKVNWNGSELVGFKIHLPSTILEHDALVLSGGPTEPERGNILTWEQHLADRRAGTPIAIKVRMDQQSILRHTLTLFIGAFIAAIGAFVGAIWIIKRSRRLGIGNR